MILLYINRIYFRISESPSSCLKIKQMLYFSRNYPEGLFDLWNFDLVKILFPGIGNDSM